MDLAQKQKQFRVITYLGVIFVIFEGEWAFAVRTVISR
jgi:hypothetical protein